MDEKDLIINEMAALNANQAITIASLKASLTIQAQNFQQAMSAEDGQADAADEDAEPEKPEFPDHKSKRAPAKKAS